MKESRRRVAAGIRMLEVELSKRPWLARNQFSLADINSFNLAYALPLAQPALSNDELTPSILRWLRAIYARPATKACWAMGRTSMVRRVRILEQPHIAGEHVA